MDFLNNGLLLGALLLFVSIIASVVSSRLGIPLLLIFLALGMLAGEDGPGGIHFNDVEMSYVIGMLSLAIIILNGGMHTRAESFRVGLRPALSLATVGVVLTAVLVGLFAAWILNLELLEGLLIGAIVGSTDAAAVFSLLHARGMHLEQRVGSTLEIESGSNDPMAVFLTLVLVEALAAGKTDLGGNLMTMFVLQFGVGALLGVIGGHLLAWLINHVALVTGFYPLLVAAGGVLIYAVTSFVNGSGFLAIYLVGLILGNRKLQAAQYILRVHDGLAWLCQIGMFLILGLLVTPSKLLPLAPQAMAISLALLLIARPVAVWVSLLPFHFSWKEQLYIAWVGLRGAVPIILALFPWLAGLEHASMYFYIAFFVVLTSLLFQGWTVTFAARLLGLEVPAQQEPVQRIDLAIQGQFDREILLYQVAPGSRALNFPLARLPLPAHTRLLAVLRGGEALTQADTERLASGDYVCILATSKEVEHNNRLFGAPARPAYLTEQRFFGGFVLDPKVRVKELAAFYGVAVPAEFTEMTLAGYITQATHGRPVVGDRVGLGHLQLVVREMDGNKISRIGLKFKIASP